MYNLLRAAGYGSVAVCALFILFFTTQELVAGETDMDVLRREAAQRTRRVIFNNDGDDYRANDSIREFLDYRTRPLLGTHVDTIFYSTERSGFVYNHRTEEGVTVDNARMRPFLEWDTDPLALMVQFCRENDIEIFWSMRMNDTHDAWRGREALEASGSIKNRHPDLMIGSENRRPLYGAWSAFDYSQPLVRELAVAIAAEVCRNYDIDGVELDFFRHPMFFKKVAWGRPAGSGESAMMTAVVREIREALDREARRRGRPLLLAVRAPDDPEYCLQLGLDLEKWLSEGWVDIFIPSGYFRLRPWEASVQLARRHGVRVYPCLTDSRVISWLSTDESRVLRQHPRGYRARAMNAWNSGADGIYIFNLFDPHAPQWSELGDPELLASLDKYYFASALGEGRVPGGTWPYRDFIRIPTLNPDAPLYLHPGTEKRVDLLVGEDIRSPGSEPRRPVLEARVRVPELYEPEALRLSVNGHEQAPPRRDGKWLVYNPGEDEIKQGWNSFQFDWNGDGLPVSEWTMAYNCDYKLTFPDQLPWRRTFNLVEGVVEKIIDGTLLLADRDTDGDGGPHLVYPWHVRPGEELVVEARLRVRGDPDPRSVVLRLADGESVVMLQFMSDGIELVGQDLRYDMDTAAAFHTYRVELEDDDVVVYVDGREVIDGRGRFVRPVSEESLRVKLGYGLTEWNDCSLYIGSASGPGRGEAFWDFIRFDSAEDGPLKISDLYLRVAQ